MRIGIITFWSSDDNYGQIFQSFALQSYLRDCGHDAYVIRYIPKSSEITKSKITPNYIVKYIKFRIQKRRNDNAKNIKRDFDTFRNNINYSKKIYKGFKELASENWKDTDAFICGSDQIWSFGTDDKLRAYFLQFAPFQCKRIAYAPSFGTPKLSKQYEESLSALLKGFDAISVRESSGLEIIKKAGHEACKVCDPTILLNKENYTSLINNEVQNHNDIFCYFISWETDTDFLDLKNFCKAESLTPRLFATKGFTLDWLDLHPMQSPEEWLRILSGAKYSVINSFHGVVFSILFHKPFAVYLLKGVSSAMNTRVYSLLEEVGLLDRIISESNDLKSILSRDVDWNAVDAKIDDIRRIGKDYLDISLSKSTENKLSPMNICFITRSPIHHYYGGLDRVTEQLSDKFEEDGHKVIFLSLRNREKYDERRQVFFPDSNDLKSEKNIEFLSDLIDKNKIDVVINQEGSVNICVPVKSKRKPLLITCHHFNPNYIDDRHYFYRFVNSNPLLNLIGKIIYYLPPLNYFALRNLRNKLGVNYKHNLEWADRFVLLSARFNRSFCNLIKDDANIEKLEAIHNPAYNLSISESSKKENLIIYVGRLDNGMKHIDNLIINIGKILDVNPEWRFVICGDGPDRKYLENLAKNISDRISLVGYCNPEDYYKKASIIVLNSSKAEGWGMVLIEAMSHGVVPVVMETYESIRDIVDDGVNGFVAEPNNVDFLNKINILLEKPSLLKRFSSSAIEKVKEFDIEKTASQWYKLFAKCFSH